MRAGLILADQPGAWTTFESGGLMIRARIDPMWLGPEMLADLLDKPQLVRLLFDTRSQVTSASSDPFGRKLGQLFTDYLDAVGLGLRGLVQLQFALEHLDLVELDLLREGLEIREWLDPAGQLSSRRVVLLLEDWRNRPETCVGARRLNIFPASKAAIAAAQAVSSAEETHYFLKSPDQIDAEERQLRRDREKRERITRQQAGVLAAQVASEAALHEARAESLRMLEEITSSGAK